MLRGRVGDSRKPAKVVAIHRLWENEAKPSKLHEFLEFLGRDPERLAVRFQARRKRAHEEDGLIEAEVASDVLRWKDRSVNEAGKSFGLVAIGEDLARMANASRAEKLEAAIRPVVLVLLDKKSKRARNSSREPAAWDEIYVPLTVRRAERSY